MEQAVFLCVFLHNRQMCSRLNTQKKTTTQQSNKVTCLSENPAGDVTRKDFLAISFFFRYKLKGVYYEICNREELKQSAKSVVLILMKEDVCYSCTSLWLGEAKVCTAVCKT